MSAWVSRINIRWPHCQKNLSISHPGFLDFSDIDKMIEKIVIQLNSDCVKHGDPIPVVTVVTQLDSKSTYIPPAFSENL